MRVDQGSERSVGVPYELSALQESVDVEAFKFDEEIRRSTLNLIDELGINLNSISFLTCAQKDRLVDYLSKRLHTGYWEIERLGETLAKYIDPYSLTDEFGNELSNNAKAQLEEVFENYNRPFGFARVFSANANALLDQIGYQDVEYFDSSWVGNANSFSLKVGDALIRVTSKRILESVEKYINLNSLPYEFCLVQSGGDGFIIKIRNKDKSLVSQDNILNFKKNITPLVLNSTKDDKSLYLAGNPEARDGFIGRDPKTFNSIFYGVINLHTGEKPLLIESKKDKTREEKLAFLLNNRQEIKDIISHFNIGFLDFYNPIINLLYDVSVDTSIEEIVAEINKKMAIPVSVFERVDDIVHSLLAEYGQKYDSFFLVFTEVPRALKMVNDVYGFQAGAKLVSTIAKYLIARHNDLVGSQQLEISSLKIFRLWGNYIFVYPGSSIENPNSGNIMKAILTEFINDLNSTQHDYIIDEKTGEKIPFIPVAALKEIIISSSTQNESRAVIPRQELEDGIVAFREAINSLLLKNNRNILGVFSNVIKQNIFKFREIKDYISGLFSPIDKRGARELMFLLRERYRSELKSIRKRKQKYQFIDSKKSELRNLFNTNPDSFALEISKILAELRISQIN